MPTLIEKSTYRNFLSDWLSAARKTMKASTYSRYYERTCEYVLPLLGERVLCEITAGDIQGFLERLSEQGLSHSVLVSILSVVRVSLSRAADQGYIAKNPCEDVHLPGSKPKEAPVLSPKERAMLELSAASAGRAMELAVLLAMHAGLRIGEICALRWRDVDSGVLTVRSTIQRVKSFDGDAKSTVAESSVSRNPVSLSPFLREKLQEYGKGFSKECYILTGSRRPTEPRVLRHKYQKMISGLGLKLPFDSLRKLQVEEKNNLTRERQIMRQVWDSYRFQWT